MQYVENYSCRNSKFFFLHLDPFNEVRKGPQKGTKFLHGYNYTYSTCIIGSHSL